MSVIFLRAQWDRVTAICALLIGLVVLTIGYYGVADDPFAAGQIPYVISAGVGSIFCLGLAGTLWLSADLKDEWRKLDELLDACRRCESEGATSGAVESLLPSLEARDPYGVMTGSVLRDPAEASIVKRPSGPSRGKTP